MEKSLSTQAQQQIVSAFAPLINPPLEEKTNVTEVDIVDTLIIDTYETDEEGNVKPVTKQIVTGRKNRKEYIESFSDEAGLDNIIKKIAAGAIAEDKYSILNGQAQGTVNDLRGFDGIENLGDIQAMAANAEATFAHLDPALKNGMSYKEFIAKFNNDDLTKYVEAKLAAQQPKKEGENQ